MRHDCIQEKPINSQKTRKWTSLVLYYLKSTSLWSIKKQWIEYQSLEIYNTRLKNIGNKSNTDMR